MRKLVKYGILLLLHGLFMIITALFPKKKNLWLFGCWEGKAYSDNAKYLFEWINQNHSDIEAIWITSEIEVYRKVKNLGLKVRLAHSFSGFLALARASVVVETEGNTDIGGYCPGRCKVIQLWHGVAPKKMNYMKKYNKFEEFCRRIIFNNHSNSYWMVSSEQNSRVMNDFFNIKEGHIFVTGYPRNDILLKPSKSPIADLLEKKFPGHKKLIYMPTHRNFGENGALFTLEQMREINEYLRCEKYVLVFKPHFHELKNYLQIESELTNIVLAKDQKLYGDVYSYIETFDVLIGDYSSIIYDFLCTKKPIVLFPYDLNNFKESDGLFEYYESMECGPFTYSWNETLAQCTEIMQKDNWYENRERCRKLFHPFNDGRNCERVYDAITNVIGGVK